MTTGENGLSLHNYPCAFGFGTTSNCIGQLLCVGIYICGEKFLEHPDNFHVFLRVTEMKFEARYHNNEECNEWEKHRITEMQLAI